MKTNKKSGLRVISRLLGIIGIVLVSVGNVWAQDQTTESFWTDPFNSPMLPLYVMMTFIAVVVILVGVVLIYVIKVMNVLVRRIEMERAAKLGVPYKASPSWWVKMWDRLNATVPIEEEHGIDTGHSYDGIRELDNHLPPWWTGLFYATIIWGVIYLVVYHVTDNLPLSGEEYQQELAQAKEEARILQASRPAEVIDEATLAYTNDPAILDKGKAVFTSNNCGSCHRNDGGGNAIGPNLTDNYWIHGGSIQNIFSTVNKGVVEKGMPAWGKVMSPKDVRDVTFFVMSLKGTNPPNAKASQGVLYEEPATPADTTATNRALK